MYLPYNSKEMKKYRCTVCDWVYDPAIGDPESGVAPGPLCGVGKDDFEVVEE